LIILLGFASTTPGGFDGGIRLASRVWGVLRCSAGLLTMLDIRLLTRRSSAGVLRGSARVAVRVFDECEQGVLDLRHRNTETKLMALPP
jgi:hypothetical protein